MSSFCAHAVALRAKANATYTVGDAKFGLEFFCFLRLPSVFPASGIWFFSEPPGSITGKKLCSQMGSAIFDKKHHMTEFIAPVDTAAAAAAANDHAHWITTTIDNINEANSPLILSSLSSSSDDDNNNKNNTVLTPDSKEKFQYLGQTDINRIIMVASFPTTDSSWSPPCLVCIGFPTAPRGGLTVNADDLWKAPHGTDTAVLTPGNIRGPTPSSSSMFMFGTFSNSRGKKDPPPPERDIQPQLSPSLPLGILTDDGILCWEERLHKSVIVPLSPSMDALIHSKSTASAPSAAESGVSPPVSVPLLDEEKTILAAIQKSLSSAKAEVFHQGPSSTHLDFSATLTGLDDDTPVCVLPRYLVMTGPSSQCFTPWHLVMPNTGSMSSCRSSHPATGQQHPSTFSSAHLFCPLQLVSPSSSRVSS
jgi:hypothetical protein